MSAPESKAGSAVLRTESKRLGSRRLPLAQSSEFAEATAVPQEQPDRASLRAIFAQDLAGLEEEVRARALAEAREVAERELATAREKLQAELKAKFEDQLRAQQQSLEQQRAQLKALVGALEAQHAQMSAAMEPIIGRLTLAVVLRLLGRHIAEHVLVADLASHALEQYRLHQPLRIRVAEADYHSILAGSDDSALKAALQIDHDASVGSCLIDFGAGQLDAGLETQLEALRRALLGQEQGSGDRVAAL
ncbi:FliH/SctL family protein [Pseudomonas sp. CAU 1711]|uniref:FliH/SctL family protein n=1 Tax=Pseudomonas sp. CAU 1711 TaxID=3140356 RepID=UPI00326067B8